MDEKYEIKIVNNSSHTWRLPRSNLANFGMIEVRPNSNLEFNLQEISRQIYGQYRVIELSQDRDTGRFMVKTKKRKGWKMEKQPDKFYIRLLNNGNNLIEGILLNHDEEGINLPLGIEFEMEISPFSRSIIYQSIEIRAESETRVRTEDPGYGLGKYKTVFNQNIVRIPRCESEMKRVKRIRSEYQQKKQDRAFDEAVKSLA